MPGCVAGGDGAGQARVAEERRVGVESFRDVEGRAEPREGVERAVAARVLVDGDRRFAALGVLRRHRDELVVEPAGVDRGNRLLLRGERERILVLPADVLLDRDAFGVRAHVAVVDGAPQAVHDGRVAEHAVAEAIPEARPVQQERAHVHVLHAARYDDFGVTGLDLGGGEHDRLHAGTADAVDRGGAGRDGQAGCEGRLARRRLPDTRLEHLAHQDVVDACALRQAGALDGRPDGDAAKLGGRGVDECAAELADRRPRRADQEHLARL